jgi:hypothetical protein
LANLRIAEVFAFQAERAELVRKRAAQKSNKSPPQPVKKWLKSYEVKKILNISTGTLQNLRSNGTLPHTKIGGLIYYDAELINKVLAGQKDENQPVDRPILKKS